MKTFKSLNGSNKKRRRLVLPATRPSLLMSLPRDALLLINEHCCVKTRCALYATCTVLHDVASYPHMHTLRLCTSACIRTQPLHKYGRTMWNEDADVLQSVLCDPRFECVRNLALYADSPVFAPLRRPHVASPRLPMRTNIRALESLRIECDPRICPAPSATLMRRLIPSFSAQLISLTLHNMLNVGVGHFTGIQACTQLRALHLRNCRMEFALAGTRRSVDGTLLAKCANIRSLTFDVQNAGTGVVAALHSGGIFCTLSKLRSFDAGRCGAFCALAVPDFMLYFIRSHPYLHRLRVCAAAVLTLRGLFSQNILQGREPTTVAT